jgi:hypothetical protein
MARSRGVTPSPGLASNVDLLVVAGVPGALGFQPADPYGGGIKSSSISMLVCMATSNVYSSS